MNKTVPLVLSAHLTPFVQILDDMGSPTTKLLNKAGLSRSVLEKPNLYIPELNVWQFLDIASTSQGIENLGLIATNNTSLKDFGELGEQLLAATNLFTALQIFFQNVEKHNPGVRKPHETPYFWLKESINDIWFCRKGLDIKTTGSWQAELHTISFMIEIIRAFTQSSWLPTQILLQSSKQFQSVAEASFPECNIEFNYSISAFKFSKSLFTLDNLQSDLNLSSNTEGIITFKDFIADAITHIPEITQFNINGVSNFTGIPPRTIQRYLKAEDTKFRDILDAQRFQMAKVLLQQPDEKISTIALRLGYTEPMHFMRAFKRWSGLTATEYRTIKLK